MTKFSRRSILTYTVSTITTILVGSSLSLFSSSAYANEDSMSKWEEEELLNKTLGPNIVPSLTEGGGSGGASTGPSISSYDGPINSTGVSEPFTKHTPGCGFNQAGAKPGVHVTVNGKDVFLRCGDK